MFLLKTINNLNFNLNSGSQKNNFSTSNTNIHFSSKAHPFHMVKPSIIPFLTSWSVFCMALGAISIFHKWGINWVFWLGISSLLLLMAYWFRTIFKEADAGAHTSATKHGFRIGFILFILSEVMFFVSFFWAFFHSSLAPSVFIGGVWPPLGIQLFNPFSVPLLNTFILLTSGVTITRTHLLLLQNNWRMTLCLMDTTILLGLTFLAIQFMEYNVARFNISDGIYGSIFYLLTGFHGFHVLVGVIFLIITRFRIANKKVNSKDHGSFEFASWYWHFVDIVWIFVYSFVYIWSGRFI